MLNKINRRLSNRKILIIGIKHAVQWNGGINFRTLKLKDAGLSDGFLEKDKECMKRMRSDMRDLCNNFNPDLVIEEGGPYLKTQADIWKNNISGKKILLEEDYGNKHKFADAKIFVLFGRKIMPSNKKRENVIALAAIKEMQKNNNIGKICIIIGGLHIGNIKKIINSYGIAVETQNLNEKDYIKELDELYKEEKEKLNIK